MAGGGIAPVGPVLVLGNVADLAVKCGTVFKHHPHPKELQGNVKWGFFEYQSSSSSMLIGKALRDSVEVVSPGGAKSYEIIKVDYI